MSLTRNKKLNILRKKIDILDNQLFSIISKRTIIVKEVLKTKKYKKEIIDKKRISQVLKNIKNKSIQKNIDPNITLRIWKNIIWSQA